MNQSPLLAAAYDQAWNNPVAIADGMLAFQGIRNPTTEQHIFAAAVGEFLAHANRFFRPK